MSDRSIVNVRPTKKFFIDSITRDIGIEQCITDLIDNSISGAKRSRKNNSYMGYYINIVCAKNSFTIEDNCGGIPLEEAKQYVFRFGNNDDNLKSYSSSGFGIGMKRAFFKIGKSINVESTTGDSRFVVKLNVGKWLEDNEWTIVVESKDNLGNKIGTKIQIKEINKPISKEFEDIRFTSRLVKLIEKRYCNDISKGLEITINRVKVNRKATQQEELYAKSYSFKNVKINVIVMKDKIASQECGWDIILNGKMVIAGNKDELTGWGKENKEGKKINWDDQVFGKFRGSIFAETDNPLLLPFTTTKEGIDKDTEVYHFIVNKMLEAIQECTGEFTERNVINIQYAKPADEVELLKKHFNVSTARGVGINTYDEYFKKISKVK